MATRLYIASNGASDVLAATLLHVDPARPPVAMAYAWERLAVDPEPGPRRVADFENLGHDVPGLAEITADPRSRSPLSRLAATLNARIFLLDPSSGAQGMRAQIQAAVTHFQLDEVAVVDLGGAILAQGDEPGLRAPLADALVLAAVQGLGVPTQVLVVGPGFDGELTEAEALDQQFYLGGQIHMPLLGPVEAARVGDALDWFPGDANRLLVAAIHGYHGAVEIRENGAVVHLSDSGAEYYEFDTARVLAGNPAAQALVDTRSLTEANDLTKKLLGRTELDEAAALTERPRATSVDVGAVVVVLEAARERGVDYLTPGRLAELLGVTPAAVTAHTRDQLLVPTDVAAPGSLSAALDDEQARLDYMFSQARIDLDEDPRIHRPLIPVAGAAGVAELTARAGSKKVGDRVAVISDANTPAQVLVALAGDRSANVRLALARRVPVPAAVLRVLASDADRKVREAVAENVGCPPDALVALVADQHGSVRYSVPSNPQVDASVERAIVEAPDEKLRAMLPHFGPLDAVTRVALAADESVEVRRALATRTADAKILAALAADPADYVRVGVASNQHASDELRRQLAGDRAKQVRGALIYSGELPEDLLQQLAHDRSIDVRWWLATAPTTPRHIREILQNDPHEDVARQAKPPSQR